MEHSIVVPVFNEEAVMEGNIKTLIELLRGSGEEFELIIADDGSTDSTSGIIERTLARYPEARVVRNERNLGRGAILTKAFGTANGEVAIYVDADLSIDLGLLSRITDAIEAGADIAVGSKHIKGAEVDYPPIRHLFSKAYALLSRAMLGHGIKDCQCGFKGFRREVLEDLLPEMKSSHWFWDTEILTRARWRGYAIAELPAKVKNIYKRESKVNLLGDSFYMGRRLVMLSLERLKRN